MIESVIVDGLSAGAVVVILCTSLVAEPIRQLPYIKKLLECCFCTSFWVSLGFDPSTTVFATMAVANITVLLIHWGMTGYVEETYQEDEIPEGDA